MGRVEKKMAKLMKRVAIVGILVGIAWLFGAAGNFSLDTCKAIQHRMGDLEVSYRGN
jgi:hypothetical protein